jgi:hypothetical protein
MMFVVHIAWNEQEVLRFLNLIGRINARIIRAARGRIPQLYDSGVIYKTEEVETFSGVERILEVGEEDCDGLAPYRMGEVLALGSAAIRAGDPGYAASRKHPARSYPAEVLLTSRTPPGVRGMHHAITRYRIGGTWFEDDPSARLGMRGNKIDPIVAARWRARGILDAVSARWAAQGHQLVFPVVRKRAA